MNDFFDNEVWNRHKNKQIYKIKQLNIIVTLILESLVSIPVKWVQAPHFPYRGFTVFEWDMIIN